MKQKFKDFVSKIDETKLTISTAVVGASPVLMSVAASAADTNTGFTAPSIATSVTSSMFNQILTQMTDLLPILLPVVVGCLAFRKGISFLKSMIMGA